jgi:hypothetical protein
VYDLAGALPDTAKVDERPSRRDPRFLLKLAPRRIQDLLAGLYSTLGDSPRPVIPVCPERAAGMCQKKLQRGRTSTTPE